MLVEWKYLYLRKTSLQFSWARFMFLWQLLDTGFFHADPHPGNMIRTPDGKLAILDFGESTLWIILLRHSSVIFLWFSYKRQKLY